MRISSQLLLTFLLNACLADRTHRSARSLRLMAVAKLRRALSALAVGQCALSRVSRSGIHLFADPVRRRAPTKFGSAVRQRKAFRRSLREYVPNLSGTRTALPFNVSVESNSWFHAARDLFRAFFFIASSNWCRHGKLLEGSRSARRTRAGRSSRGSHSTVVSSNSEHAPMLCEFQFAETLPVPVTIGLVSSSNHFA